MAVLILFFFWSNERTRVKRRIREPMPQLWGAFGDQFYNLRRLDYFFRCYVRDYFYMYKTQGDSKSSKDDMYGPAYAMWILVTHYCASLCTTSKERLVIKVFWVSSFYGVTCGIVPISILFCNAEHSQIEIRDTYAYSHKIISST